MQQFRATEALGANSNDDAPVWELVRLGQEQHFRATERFGANSEDIPVWWSNHLEPHRRWS